MLTDYKQTLHQKLNESMIKERNHITEHIKCMQLKKHEVKDI